MTALMPQKVKKILMTDKTILQMRDRQQRVFRIATDPTRYGLTLKLIAADADLGYDSVRHYASGETIMPITALFALVGVVPDELLSHLLPEGRSIVSIPEELDHDQVCEAMVDYLAEKQRAHHPDSPGGREIAECEDNVLRGKFAQVAA